jgi:hypothetical protein
METFLIPTYKNTMREICHVSVVLLHMWFLKEYHIMCTHLLDTHKMTSLNFWWYYIGSYLVDWCSLVDMNSSDGECFLTIFMTFPLQISMHWKTKCTSTQQCDLSCLWLLWHVVSVLTCLNKALVKLSPIESCHQRKNNFHLWSYKDTWNILFTKKWHYIQLDI